MSSAMQLANELLDSVPGYVIGHENRERVREYFLTHVGCSNVDCSKALGLSVYAVGRHVAKLREEWAAS